MPPNISASCTAAKAYDTAWNELSTDELNQLKSGDKVRFTVAGNTSDGTFDKAKFQINNTLSPEVTTKKPGSDEFYYEYTIKATDTGSTMNVSAWVHHQGLDQWF